MIRKSVAAVSVLGSAALAAAALTTTVSAASPTAGAPSAAPEVAATAYPASSTTITKVKRHGEGPVTSKGSVEVMNVVASGLPKKTEFDFFVLQVPDFLFGLAWYQGDFKTDKFGKASAKFIGRFNKETFTVALNTAPAPTVHSGDANSNPGTRPVHQHHLGFWFNDPAGAAAAGCSNGTTPFNAEHNAGAQAMSTAQFPGLAGPLKHVKS